MSRPAPPSVKPGQCHQRRFTMGAIPLIYQMSIYYLYYFKYLYDISQICHDNEMNIFVDIDWAEDRPHDDNDSVLLHSDSLTSD